MIRLFWIAVAALVVNSAYIAAAPSPTLIFYANIGAHVVLGIVLSVAFTAWLLQSRRGIAIANGTGALFLFAAATGGWLAIVGATRAHESLRLLHAGAGVSVAIALAAWIDRWGSRQTRSERQRLSTAAIVGLAVAIAGAAAVRFAGSEARGDAFRVVNPLVPPLSMADESAAGAPFAPSSARTNVGGTIPSNFFMTSAACGRCHKDIYDQWNSSAHHFSSFNNQWYRKSIEYMQDVAGTRPSKWCAGCHDHAVFFNGRFDRPIREQIETPEAQAGLACTSCHSIVHVGSSMGQGDFTVEYPPLHDVAASSDPFTQRVHDTLLYLAPGPHRDTFIKPFHRQQAAEFCSSCHKVHLDVPVNDYRWFRGFNDYDNWQASGVSGQGARSFYYPATPQTCTDCHMARVPSNDPAAKGGMVRSHRFAAANTALPFVNHDPVQLAAVQNFLRDGQISVDLFGIVRTSSAAPRDSAGARRSTEPTLASTFAVGEESAQFDASRGIAPPPPQEVLAPLDAVPVAVRRGESVRLEVVVRTRKVGHFFPGGTVDAFDVWVELEAVDDRGRVLLHSGEAADGGSGPVDPGAHFYRSLQLDGHGNPINKRNAWMTRSVAYVRLIPPGAADTVHYRLDVPADAGDRIFLRAKVNYRKFAWWNTQWSYAGIRDSSAPVAATRSYDDGRWVFTGDTSRVSGGVKAIPDIPTTVMAHAETTLRVLGATEPLPQVNPLFEPRVRERWNDYGIGLLLQGDVKAAEQVFAHVTAMDPAYADGPVNVARAQIQEGDMVAAMASLERALAIAPTLAKTHYFMGTALKSLGRYDEALDHLRRAAAQYPRDRVVLDQIGRLLFLERRFDAAVAALQQTLRVDPEDLQAHYNLMLCYQALGRDSDAQRERTLYERFKADEAAQAITGPFRLASPDDNNERQSIHEHGNRRPPAAPLVASASNPN